jgi:ribosomal protein L11 methyltransferase
MKIAMNLCSCTIEIRESASETLSDLFLGWGAHSVSIEYAQGDGPEGKLLLDPTCQPAPTLDMICKVKVLLDKESNLDVLLHRVQEVLAWEKIPAYSVQDIPEQDWVQSSREQFLSFSISNKLWIVPTWHDPPDPDAVYIRLDPGSAFGTGRHPTTRLCLEWLVKTVRGGESLLDYGCGSGILAIAAMKLGTREAVGIDSDPQAIEVTAANARLNGVNISFYLPEEAPELQADLVVANIFANPLQELAPRLAGELRKGGKIALSGILTDQAEEVARVYAQWFEFTPPFCTDGWACLTGDRR